jgi:hypothetical protein
MTTFFQVVIGRHSSSFLGFRGLSHRRFSGSRRGEIFSFHPPLEHSARPQHCIVAACQDALGNQEQK